LVARVAAVVDSYFKSFCDGRESGPNNLILTHIYLLIGCAFAPTISFVLLDGGFFSGDFLIFGLSGVVFLGIGDSLASIVGKDYGSTPWVKHSSKTHEGSTVLVFAVVIVLYLLSVWLFPRMCTIFLYVILATIGVAVVEGCTLQHDNLVCPVFFFIALLQLYEFFMTLV